MTADTPILLRHMGLVAMVAAIACSAAPEEDEEPQTSDSASGVSDERPPSADSAARPPDSAAEADPVTRWRDLLSPGTLVRSGACPFECCMYGDWVAQSRITLVNQPGAASPSPAGPYLESGTSFRADSGFVRVTQLALVAVTERVTAGPALTLHPGDTVALLDYIGEGYYNAWIDGEVREIQDFWSSAPDRPRGTLIGEHETDWWVHATGPDGESGWFQADAEGVEIGGADACGGPA